MDVPQTVVQRGKWHEEAPDEEPANVIGSVMEFAFGVSVESYFATSYPYRAEYADKSDKRLWVMQGLDFVNEKIDHLNPRYIMNIAIRSPNQWFMYCYEEQRPGIYAYDSMWFPRIPSTTEPVGEELDDLKEAEGGQVSYCAFGQSPDTYFIRSTGNKKDWHPRLSSCASKDLLRAYQDEYKRGCPRAVTFGANGAWILYRTGTRAFRWSNHGLPIRLQEALKDGYKAGLAINKAVLNPNDAKEYVLVYDSGPVYYSFHESFVEDFKAVISEWSAGMRSSGRYPVHEAIYPFEGLHDNGHDNGIDMTRRSSTTISDTSERNQMDPQSVRGDKRPEGQPLSSEPQKHLPKGSAVTRSSSKVVRTEPQSQSRSEQGNRVHGRWRSMGDGFIDFFRVP